MTDPDDEVEDLVNRVDELVEDDDPGADGGTPNDDDQRPREAVEPLSEPRPNDRRGSAVAQEPAEEASQPLSDDENSDPTDDVDEADDTEAADEDDAEDEPDRLPRTTAAAKRVGNALALVFIMPGHAIKVSLRQTIVATTRVMPFVGTSFWKGVIEWAVYQYQKAASADAVNFCHEPGGLEISAINWQSSDPDKPEQQPGWTEIGGDKTWGPGADGQNAVERLGKADVVFSDRSAHELSSSLQSRWAEALDLQQTKALVAGATVEQPIFEVYEGAPPNASDAAGGEGPAVADGGSNGPKSVKRGQTTVHASDAYLDDVLVDLSGNYGDGKGMVFSGRKYRDQKLSEADAEQMDKAETRGELAGMAGTDSDKIYRMFRWCVIAILVVLFIIYGLPMMLGGSGAGVTLPF